MTYTDVTSSALRRCVALTEFTKTDRDGRRGNVHDEINVLALVKGQERYVFLYDDAHKSDALRTLGRFASNADLSFSWYDAAVLSQKIRSAGKTPKSRRLPQSQPSEIDELDF